MNAPATVKVRHARADDRARRFSEAAGWAADGAERSAEVQGVVVPKVRYRRRLEPAAG